MAEEYLPLYFNEEGYPISPDYGRAILEAVVNSPQPVTDVWILAHGWNNDLAGGSQTYHDWISAFRPVIQQEISDPDFNPLFVGIHWPSKAWVGDIAKVSQKKQVAAVAPQTGGGGGGVFEGGMAAGRPAGEFEMGGADSPLLAPPPTSPAVSSNTRAKARFIADYRPIFDREGIYGRIFSRDFGRLYSLMYQPQLPSQAECEEFIKILKKYITRDPHSDPSEKSSILSAPLETLTARLFAQVSEQSAHPQQYEGFFSFEPLLEFFRTFTFWKMKGRAAIVGETGVYPFLVALRQAIAQAGRSTKIHLLGHSFGAKLVTASVYPAAGANNLTLPLVNSIVLLQGAFSQFAFSSQIPIDQKAAGHYAPVVERGLVANPIVVIYSQKDMANTTCYPAGMAVAAPFSSKIYEIGGPAETENDSYELYQVSKNRFGAIGANGAQGLTPEHFKALDMLPTNRPYFFDDLDGVYCLNIDGQEYINRGGPPSGAHGDILHPEIYHLALAISRRG